MESQKTILMMVGRRWFDRTYGNTYHTVAVSINGVFVHTSPITYGYGDNFLQTGYEWLRDTGNLPADAPRMYPGTAWLRENFIFSYTVADVNRKKDL